MNSNSGAARPGADGVRGAAGLILLALATALGLSGCGEPDEDRPLREEPFVIRDFLEGSRQAVHAVCYGPHRDGQRPGGPAPSSEELREDLALMTPHWRLLRVYGASGFAESMLHEIRDRQMPMEVVLGAWIAPNDVKANRRETDAAIRLANDYPDIVRAVCVGNETQVSWSAHRCSLDLLIEHVQRLRSSVEVPVTVADDFNFWSKPQSRKLAAELDFILMHAHPMWNGLQLEGALDWLKKQKNVVEAMHSDRRVVIGETGWATSVADHGEQASLIKGVPGEAEQATFHRELRNWTESEQITVFVFEAFDENWKGGEDHLEVEKHWGLFGADRSPKAALSP